MAYINSNAVYINIHLLSVYCILLWKYESEHAELCHLLLLCYRWLCILTRRHPAHDFWPETAAKNRAHSPSNLPVMLKLPAWHRSCRRVSPAKKGTNGCFPCAVLKPEFCDLDCFKVWCWDLCTDAFTSGGCIIFMCSLYLNINFCHANHPGR